VFFAISFALLRTIQRLPVSSRLRFGLRLERLAVALRHLVEVRAIRQMVNSAVAVPDDWPGRRRRSRLAWRFRSLAASEVPRRRRRRVGSQTKLLLTRQHVGQLVWHGDVVGQLTLIRPIEPCHAAIDLLLVDVLAVERHRTEHAPVYILLPTCDRHRLAEDQIRKTLLRAAAEILRRLRCVYAFETYLVLPLAGVENRNRVAVPA